MENVERGAPRTRQTAATDVLIFSKLLWFEFGAFWFSQSCCGSSLARFGFLKVAVARVWRVRGAPRSTFSRFFVVMFKDFSLIPNDRPFRKIVENVERGAPRTRQTRATAVFQCFGEALWNDLGKVLASRDAFKTASRLPKMAPRRYKTVQDDPR